VSFNLPSATGLHEVIGVNQETVLRMDLKGLIRRTLEIDRHTFAVAYDHVVRRGFSWCI